MKIHARLEHGAARRAAPSHCDPLGPRAPARVGADARFQEGHTAPPGDAPLRASHLRGRGRGRKRRGRVRGARAWAQVRGGGGEGHRDPRPPRPRARPSASSHARPEAGVHQPGEGGGGGGGAPPPPPPPPPGSRGHGRGRPLHNPFEHPHLHTKPGGLEEGLIDQCISKGM